MRLDLEKILAEYGLKGGDKIKFNDKGFYERIYTIVVDDEEEILKDKNNNILSASFLFRYSFEKVEPKKTVGDMTCLEMDSCVTLGCENCIFL
jgi:hypothetical protein